MRTKKLLLMAAVGLVATATSFAQIYSVNAVGYVNVTVPADGAKLALLANPLNNGDNRLNTVLPLGDANVGSTVFLWDEGAQNYLSDTWFGAGLGWINNYSVPPGTGFFLQATDPSPQGLNITFVGEVPQGQLVNPLPAGPNLGLKASIVPQAGTVQAQLAFPGESLDTIYQWNAASQSYDAFTCFGGGLWLPSEPVVQVAEGFFVQKGTGNNQLQWVRNFSVNP